MPRKTHDPKLLELAKLGAQAQLNDLMHEIRMLLELFPHLKDNFDQDELPVSFLLKRGADKARKKAAAGQPGRRGWSPAQRRAAAERMKKYWAARRKQEG